ncbi:MAG: DUF2849 domain-containing protein [Rhodospirillales bacterium]
MTQQVVTANRLTDGAVVYFTVDGQWSIWLSEAGIAESETEGEALLASAQEAVDANVVVEPYLIEVRSEGSTIKPVRYREAIRSKGPTTHPHHGRDAAFAVSGANAPAAFQNGL